MQKAILLVNVDPEEAEHIRVLLSGHHYMAKAVCSAAELERSPGASLFMAVILDIGTVSVDNRTVRNLAKEFPFTPILCISKKPFHPDLKVAITEYIYACLKKPVDPDELYFWIDSICGDAGSQNGQEHQSVE